MNFWLNFLIISIFVFILNLGGEKLIVNNKITKKLVIKNLIICLLIGLIIVLFYSIQEKLI